MEAKEKLLKDFKIKHIGELPEQLQANLTSLNRFQLELQTITEALRAVEDRGVLVQRQFEDRRRNSNEWLRLIHYRTDWMR